LFAIKVNKNKNKVLEKLTGFDFFKMSSVAGKNRRVILRIELLKTLFQSFTP